jgi:hypothetical protein
MSARILKTVRRRFRRPEEGAVFTLDEIPLVADLPPVVVAQGAASGDLRVFTLDGVQLVDGPDLCAWLSKLDAKICGARAAVGAAA